MQAKSRYQRILCVINNGFQVRLLFHSGLIDRLRTVGHEISVISQQPLEPEIVKELGTGINVLDVELTPSPLAWRYHSVRRFFLWPNQLTPSQEFRRRNLPYNVPVTAKLADIGRVVLPWRVKLSIHRRLSRHPAARNLLRQVRPDVLLLSSPGFSYGDAVLLNEAHSLGIKIIAVGQSWDNFSTKGYVYPKPDLMICWGEQMRQEAIELQHFPPEKTMVCGVPHFDIYHNGKELGSREEILQSFGLNPARKLIVYGTSPFIFSPYEYQVVAKIAEWVNADPPESVLGFPSQLLIRPSPQEMVGDATIGSKSIAKYEAMVGPNVKIAYPSVREGRFAYDLKPEDMQALARVLAHADVVGNLLSTFTLDSVANGHPTFCAVIDGDEPRSEGESCRNLLKFTHIANMLPMGAVRVAQNYDEMRTILRNYLANPELDKEQRQQLVSKYLFKIDGRSTERAADALLGFLS